jgi:hypothetical protein
VGVVHVIAVGVDLAVDRRLEYVILV